MARVRRWFLHSASPAATRKSGLYEDGVRKDRLDNNDMIDQLEARIRAKASQLDEARRIDVQQVEKIIT